MTIFILAVVRHLGFVMTSIKLSDFYVDWFGSLRTSLVYTRLATDGQTDNQTDIVITQSTLATSWGKCYKIYIACKRIYIFSILTLHCKAFMNNTCYSKRIPSPLAQSILGLNYWFKNSKKPLRRCVDSRIE